MQLGEDVAPSPLQYVEPMALEDHALQSLAAVGEVGDDIAEDRAFRFYHQQLSRIYGNL